MFARLVEEIKPTFSSWRNCSRSWWMWIRFAYIFIFVLILFYFYILFTSNWKLICIIFFRGDKRSKYSFSFSRSTKLGMGTRTIDISIWIGLFKTRNMLFWNFIMLKFILELYYVKDFFCHLFVELLRRD